MRGFSFACGVVLLVFFVGLAGCGSLDRPESCFPPEAVDHLSMKVTVDVDLAGIGKDTIEMEGSVAVHRSGPLGPDGKKMVGEMIGASLRGKSQVFGEVIAVHNPIQRSPCEYTCQAPGSYHGYFEINGCFWLPQHDLFIFSAEPVRVEGTAKAIPPVGQKADSGPVQVSLRDLRKPNANPVGVLTHARGEVLALVKLGE
jgi:hypothetical protein